MNEMIIISENYWTRAVTTDPFKRGQSEESDFFCVFHCLTERRWGIADSVHVWAAENCHFSVEDLWFANCELILYWFEGRVCDPVLLVYSSCRRRHYIWITSFLVMYLPKCLIGHGDEFHDHSSGNLILDLSSGVLWSIMLTNHRDHCSCKSHSDSTHMWILTMYMWSWIISWHLLCNKGFPHEITVILYIYMSMHLLYYFIIEILLLNSVVLIVYISFLLKRHVLSIYTSLSVAERLRASSASNSSSGSGVRTELNILVIILTLIDTDFYLSYRAYKGVRIVLSV
jgi:hypothetical protein